MKLKIIGIDDPRDRKGKKQDNFSTDPEVVFGIDFTPYQAWRPQYLTLS